MATPARRTSPRCRCLTSSEEMWARVGVPVGGVASCEDRVVIERGRQSWRSARGGTAPLRCGVGASFPLFTAPVDGAVRWPLCSPAPWLARSGCGYTYSVFTCTCSGGRCTWQRSRPPDRAPLRAAAARMGGGRGGQCRSSGGGSMPPPAPPNSASCGCPCCHTVHQTAAHSPQPTHGHVSMSCRRTPPCSCLCRNSTKKDRPPTPA
jgi:hypothetical protein